MFIFLARRHIFLRSIDAEIWILPLRIYYVIFYSETCL